MKGALAFAAMLVAAMFMLFHEGEAQPTAEQVVMMPRDRAYATLAGLQSSIAAKAEHATTVTGTPPVPVRFTFAHDDGRMIDVKAVAGFRNVELKAWFEDGDRPGETRVKVLADPESLLEKSGETQAFRAAEAILTRTDAQFVDGQRIVALFGGRARAD